MQGMGGHDSAVKKKHTRSFACGLLKAGAVVCDTVAVGCFILAMALVGSVLRGIWFFVPWLVMESGLCVLAGTCAALGEHLGREISNVERNGRA